MIKSVLFGLSLIGSSSITMAADCSITWSSNAESEGVTHYNVYHSEPGSQFTKAGESVTGLSTTCSGQGISERVGFVGLTAVNEQGESNMSIASFPAGDVPSKPGSLVIVISN